MKWRTVAHILSIALIIQVCSCGNSARFRRSAYVEENFKQIIEFAKTVVNESGAIVKAVILAMPNTEEYNQYQEELRAYLHKLDYYNKHSGICTKKSLDVMVTFLNMTASYATQESPDAAKEVHKLLNDNGFTKIVNEAVQFVDTFDKEKFKYEFERMTKNNNNKAFSPMFNQIC